MRTGEYNLLADEEHVDGAEVEIIKEREGGQSIVGGVLAGVELPLELAGTTEFEGHGSSRRRTMTVFPLYWIM